MDARNEQEIFADLAALCAEPGYVHTIIYFCFRDNIVQYGASLDPKDLRNLFGNDRLIGTEISTLIGLLIKNKIDFTLPVSPTFQGHIERTEALLKELHWSLTKPWFVGLDPKKVKEPGFSPLSTGDAMREPIFYGGQSAYGFQYRDLAPRKYARDNDWLKKHVGFTVEFACEVAIALSDLLDKKLVGIRKSLPTIPLEAWTLLPAFEFSIKELAIHSGLDEAMIQKVVTAFALPEDQRNVAFCALNDFNQAAAYPLVSNGAGGFVLFQQYSFFEALYDCPFYWMVVDKSCNSQAMENRGQFTEDFSRERLEHVFGTGCVHTNVDIYESRARRLGEVDVLVLFGNRAVILQAKSKRLTLEARKGNDLQIKDDFKKSVQDAYDQALLCAKAFGDPKCTYLASGTQPVVIPAEIKEIYILCVVSDHYPALAFQARQFLTFEKTENIAPPFVMDVFTLDAITEMLASPLRFLSYIERRTRYTDRILSSHELTILSYHLKTNLWLDDKYDMVMLTDDIAADLDAAMMVRREHMPGKDTPEGILTRLSKTHVGQLIADIERSADPAVIALGFMLLTISEDSVRAADQCIEKVLDATRRDHKHHDFSMGFGGGDTGLTVHCNNYSDQVSISRLEGHCERRKYAQKARSWFGVCLSPVTGKPRFGVTLDYPWKQDAAMDASTHRMDKGSKDLNELLQRPLKSRKPGRNDPCPCGSGIKYKKCCLS